MKAFFRDLTHVGSMEGGREFAASGLIYDRYENGCPEKYWAVIFLNPYNVVVEREWRSKDDVEVYICEDGTFEAYEWDYAYGRLLEIEKALP